MKYHTSASGHHSRPAAAALLAAALLVAALAAPAADAAQPGAATAPAPPPGIAADDPHYEAARAFYEATRIDDPKAVGELVTRILTELQPGLRAHQAIIADFAREVLDSPEYAEARIRTYMSMFSEYELRRLAALFRDPVYQKYRRFSIELARRTAEQTMQLFQARLPELERRIRASEANESAAPAPSH